MMNSISAAQEDMRQAYFSGAPGIVTSATVWLAATIVVGLVDVKAGVLTLLIGGVLIAPASTLLGKLMGASEKHAAGNPLAPLAMEGTVWMLLGIAIAVGVYLHEPAWFFPAMLLTIGGRYLTFSTLFGLRVYWILGAALAGSGILLVKMKAPIVYGALSGAIIEYVFGIGLLLMHRSQHPKHSS